jgi:phosphate acetyltransferase
MPTADQLALIIDRAVGVARHLGRERPRVALLSYRETPDTGLPSSLLMLDVQEKFGWKFADQGVTLVGPTSLDIALDDESAIAKGSDAGGRCDVLIAPDIVVANVLYKAFMLRPDCVVAGVVVNGDGKAIAVPSRAASSRDRIASVALATAAAGVDIPLA